MKIGPDMKPYFVQYQASKAKKHLTLKQRSVPMIVIIVLAGKRGRQFLKQLLTFWYCVKYPKLALGVIISNVLVGKGRA